MTNPTPSTSATLPSVSKQPEQRGDFVAAALLGELFRHPTLEPAGLHGGEQGLAERLLPGVERDGEPRDADECAVDVDLAVGRERVDQCVERLVGDMREPLAPEPSRRCAPSDSGCSS